jgi:hypothetical protein
MSLDEDVPVILVVATPFNCSVPATFGFLRFLVKLQIVPVENGTVTLTMSEWGKQVTATKPV